MKQNSTGTVTLFVQCLVDGVYPEVGHAVVDIFKRLALPFDIPSDQTCCGQPAYNTGYEKQAAVAARRFIDIFESSDVIVCPSGSCVDMVRHHYPALFKDDPEWSTRAENVSKKIYELTEYLVDVLNITDVKSGFKGRITYHESCHLSRRIGVKDQPRKLIQAIQGAELVEMEDAGRCCGFGGTFSVKYADISTAILEDKIKAIMESGVDTVVGCDISCLMNIQGMLTRKKTGIKALHIAQLLAS